jgi:hypothetical protein
MKERWMKGCDMDVRNGMRGKGEGEGKANAHDRPEAKHPKSKD